MLSMFHLQAMGGDDKKVVILKAGLEVNYGNSSVGDDISSAASSYFSNRGDWVLRENAFRDVEESAAHGGASNGGGASRALQRTGSSGGAGGSLIHAVAFSRGSKSRPSAFFAVATGDGQVTVRSTLGWKIISQTRFLNQMLCMAFSNGSRLLALGGEDGKLRLMATAPLWSVIAEVSFDARINYLAFSKNNERIAVGSSDGILSFVCPQENFRAVGEITGNGSDVLCIDWSSKNLAVGREDGSVYIHESDNIFRGRHSPSAVLECKRAVRSVAFGASSRFLVTGGDDGVIGVYSARGGWVLVHQISAGFGISALKWSPSGRHLAFAGESNQFQVVDTIFWAEVGEASSALWVPSARTPGQSSFASGLSFSQDGKMLAFSASQSGTRIINTVSWDVVLTLAQPAAQQSSPVVSEESSSVSSPEEGQGHLGSVSE
jgi:WD40 repeat protein